MRFRLETVPAVEPFAIAVPDGVLDDLAARLQRSRLPERWLLAGGERAERLDAIAALHARWRDAFDWRAHEARLNALEQLRVTVDGTVLHVVRHGAGRGRSPLLLANGWPSSFVEYAPVLDDLAADFELVVAGRPGYGFSERGLGAPADDDRVADLFVGVMAALGHDRFLAHGDDFGGSVVSRIGLRHPDAVVGLHVLEWLEPQPEPPASADEQAYLDGVAAWEAAERAYGHVQATRPQTLALALDDSPLGLLAWIADKWLSWSDPACGPLDPDLLLVTATIFWVTGTAASSMRPYAETPPRLEPGERVGVPTVVTAAHEERPAPPRSWLERAYADLRDYRVRERGGHFFAAEDPAGFAAELRATVATLTAGGGGTRH
jgi:pimeloyl-ACP methyl ester carboxylesterase